MPRRRVSNRRRSARRRQQNSSRYATFIEIVRFFCTTGTTSVVSATEMQILSNIRRPYRVVRAAAQAVLTQGSPNAAGIQVRILDQNSKGVSSSPHTLLGYTPRTVVVTAPLDFPFVSPQALIQNQNLVAVDAVCYGIAVKFPVMLHVTVQFQRMEEALDACVVRAQVLGPTPPIRGGPSSECNVPQTSGNGGQVIGQRRLDSVVGLSSQPGGDEQGLGADGQLEVDFERLSLDDAETEACPCGGCVCGRRSRRT